jgi:hypothetical protein
MNPPKPHSPPKESIKAFVLGCDPTAFYKNGAPRKFEYVFNLQKKGDKRYFAGILKNLEAVGLCLDCIYVQNLVTDYQSEETAKNKNWPAVAALEIPLRKQEFDAIDPSGKLPVFLTSQHLYKILLNEGIQPKTPTAIYKGAIPVKAEDNKLGRPLVALYRHYKYAVDKHPVYQEMIKKNILNL